MKIEWKRVVPLVPVLALASIAPNAFPAAQKGIASLHELAIYLIVPSALAILGIALVSHFAGSGYVARVILRGALSGGIATLGLEAVRYPGFLLGFMPGNLPELMGVLLLDQFATGPTVASSLAGFAYHFLNGASFGILFVILSEFGLVRERLSWTTGYGALVGVGFMLSPVVESLGVGFFGIEFGWSFAATVTAAHTAFGLALGGLLRAFRTKPVHNISRWSERQVAAWH